jgi:hypothetical protein
MCNCKGGRKKTHNNLDSPDHVNLAREVFRTIIFGKDISEFNDYDKIEINMAYLSLYPNVKGEPSLEDMVGGIKQGIELYDVKYRR